MTALDLLCAPWAIIPDYLERYRAIIDAHMRGERVNLQELEARLGGPLPGPERGGYEVRQGVALIPMRGPMSQRMNLMADVSGGTSTELLTRDIKTATIDPKVRAIIVLGDTPGGAVAGTPGAAAALFAARGVKPTALLVDEMAASAGYWVGSAADQVLMGSSVSQAGSIGVVHTHRDISKAEDAEGIKTTEIVAGKYKRIASQHGPLTEPGREYLQAQVDHLYSVFVDNIAQYRGKSAEQVLAEMADGRIFIGQQAIDAGLADGFHTLESLVAEMADRAKWRPVDSRQQRAKMKAESASTGPPAAAQLPPVPVSMSSNSEQVAQWAADNPEAAAALRAEGAASERQKFQGWQSPDQVTAAVAAARLDGASAEAQRSAAVRAQVIPGHEALIEQLAADGVTTGEQAAVRVLAAERERLTAAGDARLANNPPAVPFAHAGDKLEAAPAAADPLADQRLAEALAARAGVIQREAAERGELITTVAAVQRAQAEQLNGGV